MALGCYREETEFLSEPLDFQEGASWFLAHMLTVLGRRLVALRSSVDAMHFGSA